MNNISSIENKAGDNPLKDFGSESYWADFRAEVGIAPEYGFPPALEEDARAEKFQAQNNLAVLYYLGRNRAKDYERAAYWFEKAAGKGFAVSQYNLGFMYLQGKGLKQDDYRAFDLFIKAAEQGYGMAQYQVSQCYAVGRGIECSISDEYRWGKLAAESGNPLAQFKLGRFSTEEILLKEIFGDSDDPKDQMQKKIDWLVTSAVQGYAPAQVKLGNYYQHGYEFRQNHQKAFEWYSKAAEQGYRRGQYYLGNCYYNGVGTKRDPEEAVRWLRYAAEQGDSDAQFNLGLIYHNEDNIKGVSINLAESIKWNLRAAEQGNVDAMYQLIKLSQQHPGLFADFEESVPFFRKAAEQGNSDAMYQLGLIYERGFKADGNANNQEALKWIRKAAELGNVEAMYHLGQPFELGLRDEDAVKWYVEAAGHGHEKACFTLGKAYLLGGYHNIRIPQDPSKAFTYLSRAAARKKSFIIGELAVCYLCGFGVRRDLSFAGDVFKSLALKRYELPPISIIAKMALAKMYLAGEGVKKNESDVLHFLYSINDFRPYFMSPDLYKFKTCLKLNDNDLFKWVARKASMGDVRSQSILGQYYFCRQDDDNARKWFMLAAQQDDIRAKDFLKERRDELQ